MRARAAAAIPLSHDQADALGQSFVTEWAQHITPIDGVSDLIQELAQEYTISIVSNTHDPSANQKLDDQLGTDAGAAMAVSYEDSLELTSASVERCDAAHGYRDTVAHSNQEITGRRDHLARQLVDLLSKSIWQRRGHPVDLRVAGNKVHARPSLCGEKLEEHAMSGRIVSRHRLKQTTKRENGGS